MLKWVQPTITKGGVGGREEIKNEASVLYSLYRIDIKRRIITLVWSHISQ